MTPTVYGIDPSLTSTGIARIDPDGAVHTATVRSKGVKSASWETRHKRIRDLTVRIYAATRHHGDDPAVVVIESPAYAAASTSVHDRAGLWWSVFAGMRGMGNIVVPVSPSQRMMYATGTGRADKDKVLAAVVRRYLHVDVPGNDVADALVFAAIGRRLVGEPIDPSLPKTHVRAMAKITMPEDQPARG